MIRIKIFTNAIRKENEINDYLQKLHAQGIVKEIKILQTESMAVYSEEESFKSVTITIVEQY